MGGPSVGAVKPCMPGGPPDLGCMGSAPTRGRPGPLVWPDPCPDGCAGGGGGLEKAWLLLALRQRQGWAGGLGMSELWLVVSRRARPDRRAGFAEEDGEVPGAATRSFPAAEVWAWDCVTRESQCAGRRPGAAWGARGQGDGRQTGCGTRDSVRGYRVWSLSLRRQFLGLERKQGLFRGELWVYLLCSAW